MNKSTSPDLFNHYQQNAPEYTEQVLWGRVIGAIALVVAISGAAAWGYFSLYSGNNSAGPLQVDALAPTGALPSKSETDTPPTSQSTAVSTSSVTSEVPSQEPAIAPQEPATAPIKDDKDKLVANGQPSSQDLTSEPPALASISTSIEKPVTTNTASAETLQETVTATPSASIATNNENAEAYRVTVKVLNDDVAQASLTDEMSGLEPAHVLDSTANVGDGFLKLYFYTDLENRAGDTLTYSWYHNDKRVARVRVPVGSDRWRSHASKNITAEMRGDWKVVVTDRQGNRLAESKFHLTQDAS